MNKYIFILLLFGLFFYSNKIKAQSNTSCNTSAPFCTGITYGYPLGINNIAETGPDYGCLMTQPNPVWYYLLVDQPGDFLINLSSPTGNDLDFVCWGPFTSQYAPCSGLLTTDCTSCPSNTNDPGFYPSGNIVDCSYDPAPVENVHISNALTGQYYLLMVTNFSNAVGEISMTQTNADSLGAGSTYCNTPSCFIDSVIISTDSCLYFDDFYSLSGTIYYTSAPDSGVMTITDNVSGISNVVNSPFINPISFILDSIPSTSLNQTLTVSFSEINYCQQTIPYFVHPKPLLNNVIVNSSCGLNNGNATVFVLSGIPNFSYLWSTGLIVNDTIETSSQISSLNAGVYSVTVISSNGCSSQAIFQLSDSLASNVISNSLINPSCYNSCDGSIIIQQDTITGNPPYDFLWSNGQTHHVVNNNFDSISGLCVNTYQVTITNSLGCSSVSSFLLDQPSVLVSNVISNQNPHCPEYNDGFIHISIHGGTAPYTLTWSNGDTGLILDSLISGNYSVSITDINQCTQSNQIVLVNDSIHTLSQFDFNQFNEVIEFMNLSDSGTCLWDFGDGDTSVLENPFHTYSTNGTFLVCLSVYGLCDTAISCQNVIITGISNLYSEKDGIKVFPNPTSNIINIEFSNFEHSIDVSFFDLLGKEIVNFKLNQESTQIDVSKLANGFYTMSFKGNNVYLNKTFIIYR